jgi:DNA-binding NtrC family response regulator
MAGICIIDDDLDVLATLSGFFQRLGHEVVTAATGSDGILALKRRVPDVVLLDLELPDVSGLDVLAAVRPLSPVVLVFSGHPDNGRAIEAMRLGAEGVLSKPIDLELLGAAMDRAIEKARLLQMSRSTGQAGRPMLPGALLGISPAMRELARQIELFARNDPSPVLVLGEPGTGKGRVAAMLHALSPRRENPFVAVGCTGMGPGLLDDELFGRDDHRFGQSGRATGLLETAEAGTLYLDEIGALDPLLQPRLLEVLERQRFRRAGSGDEISVDVRLVASTARDLVTEIGEGRFREDLYYRVSLAPLHLPPLRARAREDIIHLCHTLIDELRAQLPEAPRALAEEAQVHLLRYAWPGNTRELRNVLERSMILGRGGDRIEVEHLPAEVRRAPVGGVERHTPRSLAEVERLHIERTLRVHSQNRTRAAKELGISRATLINKIKTYGLERAPGGRSGERAPEEAS